MKTKRKNIFKSLLALTLALIMVLGVAPISELAGVDWASLFAPKAEAEGKTYKVGDIIEFGSYPQSKVTDSSLVSALNKASKKWVSYGYYSGDCSYGSMKPGDWMKYADFTYNGTKYRAVTFSQYRPYWTDNSTSSGTNQDYNGYTTNNIYYFKYEPLKWRVLDPSTGLVLCESIIDSQAYSNTIYSYGTDENGTAYWNDAEHTHYANDYATSSIRAWLNDDFYNTAFSSSQKASILTSELDNRAYSTSYGEYDSETTYDKVFLLSWSEIQNTAYGFPANTSSSSARQAKGTDYAKCQGLEVDSSNECSIQRLRSAGSGSDDACYVGSDGDLYNPYWYVCRTDYGVRPALKISNLELCGSESGSTLISTINTDSTSVSVGDSIEITFKLKSDANASKKPNISIVVENPEIFESSVKNKKDCVVVKLTAKKVGTTMLTVTEKSTGEILYYSLNAVAQINAFDLNTVPQHTDILKNHVTNFYGYGGLIVDGMTSTKLSNGNYKVSMSVYNTKNIYGAVVTYYEDGSVCDYRMIDRFDCYETGLWDVLESMYYFPGQTANLFRKYTLYTNGNLAQKTPIDGIIVPKGGYMQITNNSEESAIAYLYNIINFAVAGTLSAAGVITTMAGINVVDKSNVASKTAAEAIMKTIKSMPKDKAADVMEDLLKDIAKQNMEAKSYDQIDDMIASTNNVLARAANIDMKSFISSSLKAVGISVAENAILSFLSTPGKWLSAIFTINSGVSYLDFSFSFVKSYKNTSIYVNAPRNGTISTMNGVKIDTQNNVDVKTVMQAFKIIDTSTITVNLSRNEVIKKSQIYNVYFARDNEKVQPSGSVKIYLPLPDDYDPENSYILRQESNGKWTKLETKRENGYLVAETDHFSLYAVAQVSKKDSIFKKIWNAILAPFRAISRFFKNLFKKIFKK